MYSYTHLGILRSPLSHRFFAQRPVAASARCPAGRAPAPRWARRAAVAGWWSCLGQAVNGSGQATRKRSGKNKKHQMLVQKREQTHVVIRNLGWIWWRFWSWMLGFDGKLWKLTVKTKAFFKASIDNVSKLIWNFCHVSPPCSLLLGRQACTNAALCGKVGASIAMKSAGPVKGAAATDVVVSSATKIKGPDNPTC